MTKTARPEPTIAHNAGLHRFETVVEGELAHCDYRLDGSAMRLVHTEVPPSLEGRGIAARLVAAALAHARDQGLSVIPVCSYVRAYMRRHPEAAGLLPEGMAL
ncbi:MAG TPA: GNAT family N-acetyltransferase [Casimicrobiaceae bacterium]|nr:GNAT family N-acetyltransferase [Casimicrobiaceae bacterium]